MSTIGLPGRSRLVPRKHPKMSQHKIDAGTQSNADQIGNMVVWDAFDMIIDVQDAGKQQEQPPVDRERRKPGRQVKLEKHVDKRTFAFGLSVAPRPEVIPEKIIYNRALYGGKTCDAVIEARQARKYVKQADVYRDAAAPHRSKFDKTDCRSGARPG